MASPGITSGLSRETVVQIRLPAFQGAIRSGDYALPRWRPFALAHTMGDVLNYGTLAALRAELAG